MGTYRGEDALQHIFLAIQRVRALEMRGLSVTYMADLRVSFRWRYRFFVLTISI